MNRKTNTRLHGLALALLLAAGSAAAFAQGTAFTYQGKLQSAGQNVNSTSDIQFSVYDADVGGNEVTFPVTAFNVEVIDGLFTTFVDFGSDLFYPNRTLFLEIAVRNPAGSGSFVPLSTRQPLTPAPFSLATRGLSVAPWDDVGIGTTSPQSRLHVVGNGYTTDSTAPYGIFETEADSFSGNQFGPQVRLRHGGPGGQDWVMVSSGSGNGPAGSFQLLRSGSNNIPFAISPTDNVGIGTNTPTNKLDVRADGYGITHRNTAGNTDLTTYVDDFEAGIGTVSSTPFSLYTNNTNRLTVLPNGNAGIGTGSPQAPLHVRAPQVTTAALLEVDTCGAPCGGQSYTEALRLINIGVAGGLPNGAGQVGLGMASAAAATATSTADVWIGTGFPTDAGNGTNDFIIATKTSATALTNRVRINGDNGNVGIGTDAPAARLHNVGTTRLDQELQFGVQNFNGTTGSNAKLYRFGTGGNGSNLYLDMTSTTGSSFIFQANGNDRFLFDLSNGTAAKTGGGAWAVLSDERTKTDIQPMTGTLDRLLRLKGHSYSYKSEFVENGRALPGMQVGLVAQEVEAIFPDWVSTGPDGLKQVTERSTTALMVEALRDLRTEKDAEIATLKARLEKLEAAIAAQSK